MLRSLFFAIIFVINGAVSAQALNLELNTGWNLVSSKIQVTAGEIFSDGAKLASIWKWKDSNWEADQLLTAGRAIVSGALLTLYDSSTDKIGYEDLPGFSSQPVPSPLKFTRNCLETGRLNPVI